MCVLAFSEGFKLTNGDAYLELEILSKNNEDLKYHKHTAYHEQWRQYDTSTIGNLCKPSIPRDTYVPVVDNGG